MIELRMLGSIDLHDARGRSIRSVLSQPKRLALLAYLSAQPSAFCSRDTLIGLFWPELDQRRARASLRQTLYYLRTVLGPGALPGDATSVEVDGNELWSDAREFQSAASAGMAARALSLYRGDLLPGLFLSDTPAFERWLEDERGRLRLLAAETASRLSEQEAQAGNGIASAWWGRRALGIRPEDEALARRLMNQLDRLGDRAGAMAVFADLTRRLELEYQLEPAPETSALAQSIRTRRALTVAHNGKPHAHEPPPAEALETSFAVLPFEGDDGDCIADGLTDEIVTDLSRVPRLRVVCQPSSALAKSRAKDAQSASSELNVHYLLLGSVRRLGTELEVAARLVDARNNRTLWAEQHTGAVALLPEIRDALVARVARTLGLPAARVNGQGPLRPLDQQVLLLEANGRARRELAKWTPEALDRAILFADAALGAWGEDEYLLATLGQGHLPHIILGTRPGKAHLAHAERSAARIMALNPESGRAFVLRALVRLRQGNCRGCANDLKAALRVEPNNPEALFWLTLVYIISGRGHQAKPVADRLLAIDPLNSTCRCIPGYIQAHSGFFEDAHPHYETMYRMEPESPVNRWCYSQLLLRAGRTREACSMMEGVIADAPGTAIARHARVFLPALRGNRAAAQRAVTDQLRSEARLDEHGSWWLSSALSISGQTDEALYWLENAVRLGYIDEPFLSRIDPCLESLRGGRRFARIMGQARKAYDGFDA